MSDPMKKAWEILKMARPYSGPDIRNEAQYEAASLEDRKGWHTQQESAYDKRLQVLQNQHTVDLTDVEHPIYQEMKQYQNLRAFHGRQRQRLGKCLASGKTECNDYYSLELEGDNKRQTKYHTTPSGKLDPYVELSQEAYNKLNVDQKRRYHKGMASMNIDTEFHRRMMARLRTGASPTFSAPKHGGEPILNKEYTKEEYENFTDDKKRKYHRMMAMRAKNKGDLDLSRWYGRMYSRLRNRSPLPVYFSPEHEQEEE